LKLDHKISGYIFLNLEDIQNGLVGDTCQISPPSNNNKSTVIDDIFFARAPDVLYLTFQDGDTISVEINLHTLYISNADIRWELPKRGYRKTVHQPVYPDLPPDPDQITTTDCFKIGKIFHNSRSNKDYIITNVVVRLDGPIGAMAKTVIYCAELGINSPGIIQKGTLPEPKDLAGLVNVYLKGILTFRSEQ
jgi:hypothetical protein